MAFPLVYTHHTDWQDNKTSSGNHVCSQDTRYVAQSILSSLAHTVAILSPAYTLFPFLFLLANCVSCPPNQPLVLSYNELLRARLARGSTWTRRRFADSASSG